MNKGRALDGVKVVELATFIAAPACARFLADQGADVIKVESLSGDGRDMHLWPREDLSWEWLRMSLLNLRTAIKELSQ